ncbi:hypothetical protein RI129_002609 [Pyrocoelia pectoralis]|uniref:Major facilitator superfamily (MFS) profile domain-containing protein n=1 Tax=Pyrocoelia pectoralis TaxID=417401 RepID=A0AAN7ZLL9_9COLE
MVSPIAMCIGSPIGGILIDRIGRKNTLLMLAISQIVSWICVGASSKVYLLFVGRIIAGISDGVLVSSLPVYVCEILQPRIRGYFGSLSTFGICLGSLLINIYGSFTSVRLAAYISIIFPSLFVIAFIALPESPYYLIMKDRVDDARKSLEKLRSDDEVETDLVQISFEVSEQVSEPGKFKHIFTVKSNLKACMILICLRTFQQFSGLSSLGFYNQVIFHEANSEFSPEIGSIICGVVKLIAAGVGTVMVERCGRRSLLLWSMTSSCISLILLGFYFQFRENLGRSKLLMLIPIIMMLVFFFVNSAGCMIVPNLVIGELLSVKVKGTVLSLVNIHTGISTGISSKLFQFLARTFGMHAPFYTFGVICIVGILFIYLRLPETKGKTFGEIQEILKGKKTKKCRIIYATRL